MKNFKLGIDIGGTKTAYGLFRDEKLIDTYFLKTNSLADSDEFVADIVKGIRHITDRNLVAISHLKIGVLVPGPVDIRSDIVLYMPNIPNVKNIRLKSALEEILDTSVIVDNDATGAAVGEYKYGAGMGHDNMIFMTISSGVGGGIILNGQPVRGSYGSAGEIGHAIIDLHCDYPCGCGFLGDIEAIASGTGMVKTAKTRIKNGEKSSMNPENITGEVIAESYLAGDPLAISIVDYATQMLGLYIANLYQILGIDTVVIGGGIGTHFGDWYLDKIRDEFKKRCPIAEKYPLYIKKAILGDEIGLYGATAII